MKLIFLDVDGVINSVRSMVALHNENKAMLSQKPHFHEDRLASSENHCLFNHIDPIAVKLLNRVTDVTEAKYVISSTHRKHAPRLYDNKRDLNYLKKYFANFGLTGEVIGYTPESDSGFRGAEIAHWLNNCAAEVTHYVIIDDSSDMLENQKREHFVHTSCEDGYSYKDYKKTLKILGAEGMY